MPFLGPGSEGEPGKQGGKLRSARSRMPGHIYRSRPLSSLYLCNGARTYSMGFLVPVLTSVETAMPGVSGIRLPPSTVMAACSTATRMAAETGAHFIDQFNNPANPAAHEDGTGPELWEQMGGRVDAVVAGAGSGGTLTGLSRFFARRSPATEMVLADPRGSVLADYVRTGRVGEAGSWLVEGIGGDSIPMVSDFSRVTRAYSVSDRESFATARLVLRIEGLLVGSSSGTLLAAALRYCREQTAPKRVATLVCDAGNRHLSRLHDESWLADQGLLQRDEHGDLRDLISRRHDEGAAITVRPDDTLSTAYNRMRVNDVSQVPVVVGDRCIGLLDESDVLIALAEGKFGFDLPVRDAMTRKIETVTPQTPPERLLPLFDRGWVAIVVDGERFLGLVTRMDLLNHLRRKLAA
ncbi:Cysteine synthase [Paramagnetospirillum magneticum AMB-1]|uniref:Cysteine synthase n=2 Tax=Paramagnetospirillum magneticum TaxID=84159 RepID=Q2W8G8_PARM1|nr:Cysteine synthase [Paramagnetospirillum magneticum AMB-1]